MRKIRQPPRSEDLMEDDTLAITLEEIADRQGRRTSDDEYPWAVMVDDCYRIVRYGPRELVAHLKETLLMGGKVMILDPPDSPQ
jgi:hypothetical protein